MRRGLLLLLAIVALATLVPTLGYRTYYATGVEDGAFTEHATDLRDISDEIVALGGGGSLVITVLISRIDPASGSTDLLISQFVDSQDIEEYAIDVSSLRVTLNRMNQTGGYWTPVVLPAGSIDTLGDYVASTTVTTIADTDVTAYPRDAAALVFSIDVASKPSVGFRTDVGVSRSLANRRAVAYSDRGEVGIRVSRRADSILYVYVVALSPLILLLAMVIRHRQRDEVPVLDLAVGALALLPLRDILIPEGASGLTDVDLILGCQFVLFVGVAAVISLGLVPRHRTPVRARTSPQDRLKRRGNNRRTPNRRHK
ncbi:hypothetical protein ABZ399_29780 [Micromonospora aurantiaca]|uniref:hypothetical protein n=1 Tax=Micromonospora aurantiaca (nom. illeg.) TaxID=47850 RepID=UPI0033E5EC3D